MKITVVFSFVVLSLTMTSCKNSTETILSTDLIPLKEGNEWIYETKIYNDSGIVMKISTDTLRVGFGLNEKGNRSTYP